jgi:hypothetical protein
MSGSSKSGPGRNEVSAIEQSGCVPFALAGADPLRLSFNDICKKAGLHKRRRFAILETFQSFGLVQRYAGRRLSPRSDAEVKTICTPAGKEIAHARNTGSSTNSDRKCSSITKGS